mgnify:CR=1 FL=1
MPNHKDKKNGKNGKKKTLPVKPPTARRGNGNGKKKTEEKIRSITKTLEPQDAKLARKIMTEPSFRKKLGNAFLTGLTFGLYKP